MARQFSSSDKRKSWRPAQPATNSSATVRGGALMFGVGMLALLGWIAWGMLAHLPGRTHVYVVRADGEDAWGDRQLLYGDNQHQDWRDLFPTARVVTLDRDGQQQLASAWQSHEISPRDVVLVCVQGLGYSRPGESPQAPPQPWLQTNSGDISVQKLIEQLAASPARIKLLLLDATYPAMRTKLGVVVNRFPQAVHDAVRQVASDSLWIVLDTEPAATALVRHDRQRSVFHLATLAAMRVALPAGRTKLDLKMWHDALVQQSLNYSQGRQRPQLLQSGYGLVTTVPSAWQLATPVELVTDAFTDSDAPKDAEQKNAEQKNTAKRAETVPSTTPTAASSPKDKDIGATNAEVATQAVTAGGSSAAETLISLWQARDRILRDAVRSPALYAPHLVRELDARLTSTLARLGSQSMTIAEQRKLLQGLQVNVGPLQEWVESGLTQTNGDGIASRMSRAEQAYRSRHGEGLVVSAPVVELHRLLTHLGDYIVNGITVLPDLSPLRVTLAQLHQATLLERGNARDVASAIESAQDLQRELLQADPVVAPTVLDNSVLANSQTNPSQETVSTPFSAIAPQDLRGIAWLPSEKRATWIQAWLSRELVRKPLKENDGSAEPKPGESTQPTDFAARWKAALLTMQRREADATKICDDWADLAQLRAKKTSPLAQFYPNEVARLQAPSNEASSSLWLVEPQDIPLHVSADLFPPLCTYLPFDNTNQYVQLRSTLPLFGTHDRQDRPLRLSSEHPLSFPLELRTTVPGRSQEPIPVIIRYAEGLQLTLTPPESGDSITNREIKTRLIPGRKRELQLIATNFRQPDAKPNDTLPQVAFTVDGEQVGIARFQLPSRDALKLVLLRNGTPIDSSTEQVNFLAFPNRTTELSLQVENPSDDDRSVLAELRSLTGELIAATAVPLAVKSGGTGTLNFAPPALPVAPPAAAPVSAGDAPTAAPAASTPAPGLDVTNGLTCMLKDGTREWSFQINVDYEDPAKYVTAVLKSDGQGHVLCNVALLRQDANRPPDDAVVPIELVVHGYQRVDANSKLSGSIAPTTELSNKDVAAARTLKLPLPPNGPHRVSLTIDGVPRAMIFSEAGGGQWRLTQPDEDVLLGSIAMGTSRFTNDFDLAFPEWRPIVPPETVNRLTRIEQPAIFRWQAGTPLTVELHADFSRQNPNDKNRIEIRYDDHQGKPWGPPISITRDRQVHMAALPPKPTGGLPITCEVRDHRVALPNDVHDGRGNIQVALVRHDGSRWEGSPASQNVVIDDLPPQIAEFRIDGTGRIAWGDPANVFVRIHDTSGVRQIQFAISAKKMKLEDGQGQIINRTPDAEPDVRRKFSVSTQEFPLEEGQSAKAILVMRILDAVGLEATKELPIEIVRRKANVPPGEEEPKPGPVKVQVVFAANGQPLPPSFAAKTKVTIKELELVQPLDGGAKCMFSEVLIPGTYTFLAETETVGQGFGAYAGQVSGHKLVQPGETVTIEVAPMADEEK